LEVEGLPFRGEIHEVLHGVINALDNSVLLWWASNRTGFFGKSLFVRHKPAAVLTGESIPNSFCSKGD
jgi:hypothetical protein